MASVVNNNYTLPSGQTTLYLGTTVNEVVGGVWTPTRIGGVITSASWAGLPLNTWVEVAGTNLMGIRSELLAGGYDITSADYNYGSGKNVVLTMNAWVGAAVDPVNGKAYIPCGGGHQDGSFNGVWGVDLNKMSVELVKMPTIFSTAPSGADPVAANASTYKLNTAANFMKWAPDPTAPPEEVTYAWPDFVPRSDNGLPYMPTSRHQYCSAYVDTLRNKLVTTRISRWELDLSTKVWTRTRWKAAGTEMPFDETGIGVGYYHAGTDRYVGNLPRTRLGSAVDDLGYINHSADPANRISLDSTGSPVQANNHAWTLVDPNTVFAVGNNGSGGAKWGYLYLDTLTRNGASQTLSGGQSSSSDMPVLCYIPEWNGAIRRLSGGTQAWRFIDMSTPLSPVETSYTPLGNPPPYVAQTGNKIFYWASKKVVVAIVGTSDSNNVVRVMRTG